MALDALRAVFHPVQDLVALGQRQARQEPYLAFVPPFLRPGVDLAAGEDVISCTIITRAADRWMSKLHDRMPVMLNPKNFDAWLDGSGGRELLEQPPPELREWIVSTRVNSNRAPDDDPTLADPVAPEAEKPEPPKPPP